jgi:hypothetical protein
MTDPLERVKPSSVFAQFAWRLDHPVLREMQPPGKEKSASGKIYQMHANRKA